MSDFGTDLELTPKSVVTHEYSSNPIELFALHRDLVCGIASRPTDCADARTGGRIAGHVAGGTSDGGGWLHALGFRGQSGQS